MRLVFLGTSEFGLPVLRALIGSEHTVVGVITGPDKPAGRGRKISSTPVGELARQQGLQTLTPSNLRNSRFRSVSCVGTGAGCRSCFPDSTG